MAGLLFLAKTALHPKCRQFFFCLAAFVGLILSVVSGAAEEAPPPVEPPPNPLDQPPSATLTRSGYFQDGGVPSPLLTPTRWRVGDFALQSTVALATIYDDNIEAADDQRNEDIFFSFSPSIRAQSLYARHSLGFSASGSAATALKNGSEDFFDWRVGSDGQLDLSRQKKINAAIGYTQETEDDEAIDAEDDQDDLTLHLLDASLSYDVSGRPIGYSIGTSVSRLDAAGSNFDDRDRTTLGVRASASYALSDRLSIFVGPSYSYSTFDDQVADDGDGRDAHVISARIGGGYRASRTIRTSASVGYSYAAFDDPDRRDDDSAIGSVGLTWDAGAGTTLDLRGSRSLGLTVVDNADSRTSTTGSATLSHRLRLGSRSIISSSLAYSITELSDLDRVDQNLGVSLGYAYRLTDHVFFSSGYRFSRRMSDDNDADYYRNLISLGLTVAY